MHTNYYYLRFLSSKLNLLLNESFIVECFSQQKDEVLLVFQHQNGTTFIIQAHLTSRFTCLYFPEQFNRAKKNSRNFFPELIGRKVLQVIQIENDRSFVIDFGDEYKLLFKLYGNRSNLVLFKADQLLSVFNRKLKNDFSIKLSGLNRTADHSLEYFLEHGYKKTFYTFSKIIERVLVIDHRTTCDQSLYNRILEVIAEFEKGFFYLVRDEGMIYLSLCPAGQVLEHYDDPLKAANAFFRCYYKQNYIIEQRQMLIKRIDHLISGYKHYLEQAEERLRILKNSDGPEKLADIIMANLHAIPKGSLTVTLYDFYNDRPVEISLKKDSTPQKYAELLYKKARNRPLEIKKLEDICISRKQLISQCAEDKESVNGAETHREIAVFQDRYRQTAPEHKSAESELFRRLDYMGYTILVGRNAANNDLLTMKYAHKNDLWLHARDVTGAHVIIRHKAGQGIPKPVIERAASVAAFHSTRKNEKLCPVIVTEKKFVRKPKGAPKGAVKVEKEKVIMVEPADL